MSVKEFCEQQYQMFFQSEYERLHELASKRKNISSKGDSNIKIQARKFSIQKTTYVALKKFPKTEPNEIWKCIYAAHVFHRSRETDAKKIKEIIAADQSWKKSSGHAFESMIKDMTNPFLAENALEIFLQKDLSMLLKENRILNEKTDILFLKQLIGKDIFDLFIGINEGNEKYKIFGVIQSKTSIRDRVTRDREPSINAMAHFFLSIAIVLDGDFLRLPKFQSMVNGNTAKKFPEIEFECRDELLELAENNLRHLLNCDDLDVKRKTTMFVLNTLGKAHGYGKTTITHEPPKPDDYFEVGGKKIFF